MADSELKVQGPSGQKRVTNPDGDGLVADADTIAFDPAGTDLVSTDVQAAIGEALGIAQALDLADVLGQGADADGIEITNLGAPAAATSAVRVSYLDSHDFTCSDTDAGNYKLRVAPNEAQAVTALATASNVNKDFDPGSDGYYRFAVTVLLKLASAGTYRRVSATVEASRDSGALTIEGSQVTVSGGNATGVTLTLSATSGSLRCNIANATGETVNGRVLVGWALEDLLP